MFDTGDPSLSEDQALALQSAILAYMREALTYDRGFMVFAVKNLDLFEFEFYYSNGSTVDVKYEETRQETVERILYTLDCSELNHENNKDINKDDVIKCIYNYVVGILSVNVLSVKFDIMDHSGIFK